MVENGIARSATNPGRRDGYLVCSWWHYEIENIYFFRDLNILSCSLASLLYIDVPQERSLFKSNYSLFPEEVYQLKSDIRSSVTLWKLSISGV